MTNNNEEIQQVVDDSQASSENDAAGEALYETSSLAAETLADDAAQPGEAADETIDAAAPALDIGLVKRVLETALLTSPEPLTLNELKRMFPRGETNNELVRKLLDDIRAEWDDRGVELVNVASGWRFRSRPELQRYLDKLNPQKAPKYSRAVMETLAIIAYKQPVTRGDIEAIRGVSVSTSVMQTLLERGWIEVIGHKDVPGRPGLYASTHKFLDDLGFHTLRDLPPLAELSTLVVSEPAPPDEEPLADEAPQ